MIIEFLNYALNGALLGLLYALVAMGFVVIYRASKVFNMATGEMLVLGAFLVWWAVASRGMHPALGIGAALAIAVLVGLAIERLFFRRLIGESVFSMMPSPRKPSARAARGACTRRSSRTAIRTAGRRTGPPMFRACAWRAGRRLVRNGPMINQDFVWTTADAQGTAVCAAGHRPRDREGCPSCTAS